MGYEEKTKDELIKELLELHEEFNSLKSSFENVNAEEEQLREKVFELRWMIEHAGDAAIYRGNYRNMQYEYWTPNVEQVLGYTTEEMFTMGQPGAVKLINQEDFEKLGSLINELMAKGGGPYSIEYRFLSKDGTQRYLSESGHAFVDEHNIPLYAIGSVRDITDRKQAELLIQEKNKAIEAQNKELQLAKEYAEESERVLSEKNQEYEALNEELRKTNEELILAKEHAEESDRLKTAFLQNVSHEIRTPMNAIMGFSDLLVENYGNKSKLEKFSDIINQRCSDLLEIINELLDISKIESGQLALNIEDCDINELFDELNIFFKEHQKRIGKQHINFSLQAQGNESCSIIQTDKVKLKQILINLIGNAFKFTENGSIECGCKKENNQLIFNVTDTGIGIPSDKHETIFERFTQLRNPSVKNYSGTGLGLSIAKALTILLGGKIWLESEADKGTTFYFSIKYIKSKSLQNKPKSFIRNQEFNFSNKTILIVEDDIYNAQYLKEILANNGFIIIIAEFGIDAIQIAKNQLIDMILMDIRLPDINGYEATQIIRQSNPQIKIIAQTAYATQGEREKAIDAGCIDCISKPTKKETLIKMITKHLNVKTG
jgi:PAS domain S-box-containing protein